jgi:dTDP-4-dehydrorhamnose 3,5-epimerase
MGTTLSAENKRILWIPEGFAHGFLVMSDAAETVYKATDYYAPGYERSLLWNDPDVAIAWPVSAPPVLSAKDLAGRRLAECDVYE